MEHSGKGLQMPVDIHSGYAKEPSPTLASHGKMRQMMKEGKTVYRLGFGGSPVPVREDMIASFREHVPSSTYPEIQGEAATREAVAEFYRSAYGLITCPENCFIYPGSKEAIFQLLAVLEGPVLLPQASWVSYAPQAEMLRKKTEWLPVSPEDDWKLKPAVLDEAGTRLGGHQVQKILILNSPGNPTGSVYSGAELKKLAAVCRRQRILVIFDGIYGFPEDFFNTPWVTMAHEYPEGTFFTGGLSKIFSAGGWRFGFTLLPDHDSTPALRKALQFRLSETCSGVCLPLQQAAVTAYQTSEERNRYLSGVKNIYKAATWSVATRLIGAGLRCSLPGGGFYVFPDFSPFAGHIRSRGYATSGSFGRLLMQSGIVALPGECFGVEGEELAFRLACVDFNGSGVLQAVQEAGPVHSVDECLSFAQKHMPRLMEACDVIEALCLCLQEAETKG